MNAVAKIKTAEPVEPITGPHVFDAIANVMHDLAVDGISKARKNQQQGYNFRGIDDVYNALAPILARHRLTITPACRDRSKEVVQTKNGGTLFYVTVDMEFQLTSAIDGSHVTARMFGEAMDSGDKATNKAMSAAYKYMAMQQFCIPTEGDNDADSTTHQIAAVQPAPSQPIAATVETLPARKSAAQAKRDGDHETFLAKIHSFTTVEALDEWAADWDILTEQMPLSWVEPMNDKYLSHRNELAEADTFPGDRAQGVASGADHMEAAH
jgi:hypothetical protein